jgi:hypothetical protein
MATHPRVGRAMKKEESEKLKTILNNDSLTDETVKQAIREGVNENKQRGNKVAVWNGEQVVLVDPEEIPDHG